MTSLDHKTLAVMNNAKGNEVRLRLRNTESKSYSLLPLPDAK